MNNVVYICPHCRERKGHDDPRKVRLCQLQSRETLTPPEIYEYCVLKEEIAMENQFVQENKEKKN